MKKTFDKKNTNDPSIKIKDKIVELSLPDINFDGRNEMIISTYGSATSLGTFGVFYLDSSGSIYSYDVMDPQLEGLNLNQDQHFGGKLSVLGDLNKDGFISKKENKKYSDNKFSKMDSNKDKKISKEEIKDYKKSQCTNHKK